MGVIFGSGMLGITKQDLEEVAGTLSGELTPKIFTVNSEVEMLSISNAKIGDEVIRTDNHEYYKLLDLPSSVLSNWKSTLVEGEEKIVSFNVSANQVSFDLGEVPINQNLTQMYINGVKQDYGIDFNVNGSIIQYLNTVVILDNNDQVEIVYFI